jgi:hypothetical protein
VLQESSSSPQPELPTSAVAAAEPPAADQVLKASGADVPAILAATAAVMAAADSSSLVAEPVASEGSNSSSGSSAGQLLGALVGSSAALVVFYSEYVLKQTGALLQQWGMPGVCTLSLCRHVQLGDGRHHCLHACVLLRVMLAACSICILLIARMSWNDIRACNVYMHMHTM